jgi:hypothetical protein
MRMARIRRQVGKAGRNQTPAPQLDVSLDVVDAQTANYIVVSKSRAPHRAPSGVSCITATAGLAWRRRTAANSQPGTDAQGPRLLPSTNSMGARGSLNGAL